jgi:hypothetical protein
MRRKKILTVFRFPARPRRTAQRLRRLPEGADEGAAHPFRIAKADGFGNPVIRRFL